MYMCVFVCVCVCTCSVSFVSAWYSRKKPCQAFFILGRSPKERVTLN